MAGAGLETQSRNLRQVHKSFGVQSQDSYTVVILSFGFFGIIIKPESSYLAIYGGFRGREPHKSRPLFHSASIEPSRTSVR